MGGGTLPPMDDDQVMQLSTLARALDELVRVVAHLSTRVQRLEREILPQDPDPDIGLP